MKTTKKLLILFIAFAAFAWAAPARAGLLSDAQLHSIIRIDRDTCAIEISFPDDGLQIPILSKIQVDGNLLVTLTGLLDLDLFADVHVLIASDSMLDLLDIDADIQINDSVCDLLRPGAVIRLLGDGLKLEDLLTLPDDFGDLIAFVLDLNVNDHLIVHLDDDVLNLSNSDGETGTVGGGGNGSGNADGDSPTNSSDGDDSGVIPGTLPGSESGVGASGGCSLNAQRWGGNSALVWAAFLIMNMMCGIRILVTASKPK